jgi:hypothetical protein
MTVYGTATYAGNSFTLYGRPGSTLRDELNRLANGGEYPAYTSYSDEDGAVNTWVGTPAGTPLISALNKKADPNRAYTGYKERNAVANEIAGITSDPSKYVEIVTALRTIAS